MRPSARATVSPMARATLTIRLTTAEKQTLELFAAGKGKQLSVWLRESALSAAGGVSAEWRRTDEGPAWLRAVSREVRKAVRLELRSTARRARERRRTRHARA